MLGPIEPPHTWFVYVIGHPTGPQKVGFSNHPPTRARALKVAGEPHLIVHYEHAVSPSDARGVEQFAHYILRDAALGSERFDVGVQTAIAAILEAAERYANGERAPQTRELCSERVQLIMPKTLVAEIEEWRKRQPGRIPLFSEAVRSLADMGITAEA